MPPEIAALHSALEAGMTALGLESQPSAVDKLLRYLAALARWGRVYNLTAVRDPAEMLTQHLLDSLSVVPALRRHLAAAGGVGSATGECAGRLLDVGSGAGLPAVVIATLLPELSVVSVDAVAKKAGFVRQMVAELGLKNLTAIHGRVEELRQPPFDVIASRAFASLPLFVSLTRAHLLPDGVWMAMKGKVPDAEIAELPPDVKVFHVEQLQVPGLDGQRCLIWMERATESM